jgi:hypothetical protein
MIAPALPALADSALLMFAQAAAQTLAQAIASAATLLASAVSCDGPHCNQANLCSIRIERLEPTLMRYGGDVLVTGIVKIDCQPRAVQLLRLAIPAYLDPFQTRSLRPSFRQILSYFS